jgi:hypothetical protein
MMGEVHLLPGTTFSSIAARGDYKPAETAVIQAERASDEEGRFTSATAPIASGWSEPVPGREFHPQWTSALHGAPTAFS